MKKILLTSTLTFCTVFFGQKSFSHERPELVISYTKFGSSVFQEVVNVPQAQSNIEIFNNDFKKMNQVLDRDMFIQAALLKLNLAKDISELSSSLDMLAKITVDQRQRAERIFEAASDKLAKFEPTIEQLEQFYSDHKDYDIDSKLILNVDRASQVVMNSQSTKEIIRFLANGPYVRRHGDVSYQDSVILKTYKHILDLQPTASEVRLLASFVSDHDLKQTVLIEYLPQVKSPTDYIEMFGIVNNSPKDAPYYIDVAQTVPFEIIEKSFDKFLLLEPSLSEFKILDDKFARFNSVYRNTPVS